MRVRLAAGLHVEVIESEILVADAASDTVVRLSGEAAEVVRPLVAGIETDVPEGEVLDGLIAHGVLEPADSSLRLSRRQLIGTAAAVTGIGIAAMAMPAPAAAASPPGPGPGPTESIGIFFNYSQLNRTGSADFLWTIDSVGQSINYTLVGTGINLSGTTTSGGNVPISPWPAGVQVVGTITNHVPPYSTSFTST